MKRRQTNSRFHPGHLVAVACLGVGLSAFALSFAMPRGFAMPGSQAQVQPVLPAYEPEARQAADFETSVPESGSRAKRVAVEPPPLGQLPVEERPPVRREAAPVEARPAVQARNVSGRTTSGSGIAAAPVTVASGGPYTLSLVVEDAALDALTRELVKQLDGRGVKTRDVALDDAGRPDAVLLLAQHAGSGADAWYCDPGPAASSRLASGLRAAANVPSTGEGEGPDESSLPCDDLHAGRSRVPGVLLELPPSSFASTSDATAGRLAGAIARYFSDNAAAVKQARSAPRLIWPAAGPITSRYGPAHPLGIDVAQAQGNVLAATGGTVVFAGGDACCGYGRYVVIDSTDGIRTLYAHFDTLAVRKGQKVRQGQALGKVGCTGHCSGPHLHFEVLDSGRRQDPMRYLP